MTAGARRDTAGDRGFPEYGDIYETVLDPVVGAEIAKRRPALIVSNDRNNEFAATVTVLPLTGQIARRLAPFEVLIPKGVAGLRLDSRVKANQIRTVDKSRLRRFVGTLPPEYITLVRQALRIHLNLR